MTRRRVPAASAKEIEVEEFGFDDNDIEEGVKAREKRDKKTCVPAHLTCRGSHCWPSCARRQVGLVEKVYFSGGAIL